MGYYIEGPSKGKVEYIIKNWKAVEIPQPGTFSSILPQHGLICVVDNGLFEAAGFCFDAQEFDAFTRPDDYRPKTWLIMPRDLAEKLAAFPK